MAVTDIRSDLIQSNALAAAITSDTTTAGAIFDTADNELGLMFSLLAHTYTDGTYTLLLEEDDVIGFGSSSVISGDQLIGTLPVVSAATASGAALGTVGVISNKRFVRASVVSASTSTGSDIVVSCTQSAEEMPTS